MNPGTRCSVFSIKEFRNKQGEKTGGAVWVRAGSAWVNADGSLNVLLDVLPMDGKLHVREYPHKPQDLPAQPGAAPAPGGRADALTFNSHPLEGHS